MIYDIIIIPLAWIGAYSLRFNFNEIPALETVQLTRSLIYIVLIQAGTFWSVGLYRGLWRFASIPDLMRMIQATVLGSLLCLLTIFILFRLEGMPRSIFPLYALLLIALLASPRLAVRWLKDYGFKGHQGKRTLIIGMHRGSENLIRELKRNKDAHFNPCVLVDEDATQQGREVQGVRVSGTLQNLVELCETHEIEVIIIAQPEASGTEMRAITTACETTGLPLHILSHNGFSSQEKITDHLRKVALEDLLGREEVSLDWQNINPLINNKTIIISGAGGSIGSELCRQLALLQPSFLILIDNSEYNLFSLTEELHLKFPNLSFIGHLTDIRDKLAIENLFKQYSVDLVFHASAYKHVPLLEYQAREAIYNNILGTDIMAHAALNAGIDKFILISSDKAVNPCNIMGATKRGAEIICQTLNTLNKTQFITVRFGNVLGSVGSVIPTFKQQLAAGGPLTVTHPEVTRFFMTIPEAVQLIVQAASMGVGGEIFVLDMGEPIKIRYLAEQLIRLSGKKPGEDIQITYTGLRPGEKMYEELFQNTEQLNQTTHGKIMLAQAIDFDKKTLHKIIKDMETLCHAAESDCNPKLIVLLKKLVPEFYNPASAN